MVAAQVVVVSLGDGDVALWLGKPRKHAFLQNPGVQCIEGYFPRAGRLYGGRKAFGGGGRCILPHYGRDQALRVGGTVVDDGFGGKAQGRIRTIQRFDSSGSHHLQ